MNSPLSHDVLIIRMGAGRVRTLAKEGFDRQFDIDCGSMAIKLYGKMGKLCEEIEAGCDELDTCLKLIKEQEQPKEVKDE